MATNNGLPSELEHIEREADCTFPNLREAAQRSSRRVEELEASISKEFAALSSRGIDTTDIGLLVTGSIARREVTEGSDCDYLLVSNATPSHEAVVASLNAVDTVLRDLELVEPGAQGVFGEFTTASELFIRIGLERDSNPNMTRRMSILLESKGFLHPEVRNTVLDRVIERYCARYSPSYRQPTDERVMVPRFLVNDLIRYWRTVAVDFEAKRWRSPKTGWGLRYAKLLSTRKIMFAGSLSSYLAVGSYLDKKGLESVEDRYAGLTEYLRKESDKPPVARLASLFESLSEDTGRPALVRCLTSYDRIIEILNQPRKREALKSESSPEMVDIIKQSSELNGSLEEVFFGDPFMQPLTRGYSLF